MVKENNDKAWTSRSTGLQGLENNEPGPKQGIHSPQNRGHDICTVWLQNCSGKTNCCELCSFWTWMIMVVIQFLSPLLFAEFGINNTSFCFTELLAKRKHKEKKYLEILNFEPNTEAEMAVWGCFAWERVDEEILCKEERAGETVGLYYLENVAEPTCNKIMYPSPSMPGLDICFPLVSEIWM